jgi:hypothetical protein
MGREEPLDDAIPQEAIAEVRSAKRRELRFRALELGVRGIARSLGLG